MRVTRLRTASRNATTGKCREAPPEKPCSSRALAAGETMAEPLENATEEDLSNAGTALRCPSPTAGAKKLHVFVGIYPARGRCLDQLELLGVIVQEMSNLSNPGANVRAG